MALIEQWPALTNESEPNTFTYIEGQALELIFSWLWLSVF